MEDEKFQYNFKNEIYEISNNKHTLRDDVLTNYLLLKEWLQFRNDRRHFELIKFERNVKNKRLRTNLNRLKLKVLELYY